MTSIYSDGTYLSRNPDWHVQDSDWKAKHIFAMMSRHGLKPATICSVEPPIAGVSLVVYEARSAISPCDQFRTPSHVSDVGVGDAVLHAESVLSRCLDRQGQSYGLV